MTLKQKIDWIFSWEWIKGEFKIIIYGDKLKLKLGLGFNF